MVASLDRAERVEKPMGCGFPYLTAISQVQMEPPKPKRRIGRWLGAACVAANACVVAAALYLGQVPQPAPTAQPAREEASLYEKVGGSDYLAWTEQYQRDRTSALMAEAEAEKEKAKNISIIASYKLADAVLSRYQPGDPVKTTTRVKVSCSPEETWQNANVEQLDGQYQDGIIGHLATCNPGVLNPGGVIGTAGKQQVSLRNGL